MHVWVVFRWRSRISEVVALPAGPAESSFRLIPTVRMPGPGTAFIVSRNACLAPTECTTATKSRCQATVLARRAREGPSRLQEILVSVARVKGEAEGGRTSPHLTLNHPVDIIKGNTGD